MGLPYGVSFVGTVLAWDTSANAFKTGDSANISTSWVKDGTRSATSNANAETDATNCPGQYKVTLTATEAQCLTGTLCGKSTTANVVIIPLTYTFIRVPNVDPGTANGIFIAGTNAPVTITGSGDALTITSSGGNGSAINASGNGSGHGLKLTPGATGNGVLAVGGATSGSAVKITGTAGNAIGLEVAGQGSAAGVSATGGATGAGAKLIGGATSGAGLVATASAGNSDGITATKAGSGNDLAASSTTLVLAKTTNLTGLNDIAATAVVSSGAITTSGGAVVTTTNVTNGVTVSAVGAGVIDSASIATAAKQDIADKLLDRDMSVGTDSGNEVVRTVRQALRVLRNKVDIPSGKVKKEDDTTDSFTFSTTTAAGNPISVYDPT